MNCEYAMHKTNKFDKNFSGKLLISDLSISVYLGCRDYEKNKKQTITMAVEIYFKNIPKGASTDKLEDTICYSKLTRHIRNFIKDKKFNLIEKFSKTVCDSICEFLAEKQYLDSFVKITVHKKMLSSSAIKGGIFFTYSRDAV